MAFFFSYHQINTRIVYRFLTRLLYILCTSFYSVSYNSGSRNIVLYEALTERHLEAPSIGRKDVYEEFYYKCTDPLQNANVRYDRLHGILCRQAHYKLYYLLHLNSTDKCRHDSALKRL